MTKISLKEVKNALKRDEMRAITGGSGSICNKGGCFSTAQCQNSCGGNYYCVGIAVYTQGYCDKH